MDIPDDTPKFSDLGKENLVHPTILRTLSDDLKFDHMTPVQAATIHELLRQRSDVLAQAKTGTGKTIAFLLPVIQTLLERQSKPGTAISSLIITPTRELALQIAEEARSLLQRLPQYKVCLAIGGTQKTKEEKSILGACDILIGTPGRLNDHFYGDGASDIIVGLLQDIDTFVLDEADRLLSMGFLDALKKIIRALPSRNTNKRQSMLFSATIPDHVEKVSHFALSKDYKFISTIQKGDLNTHERVSQTLITVPSFEDMATGLIGALRQESSQVGMSAFKAIVFAQTASLVDFYVSILESFPDLGPVSGLHARMSQNKRTKITDNYRQATAGILVATDVIARGMDFPSVTNVLQVGIPSDKESYVHRLGRTARAGSEGRGTFIITSHESYFPTANLKEISFQDVVPDLSAHEQVLAAAGRMENQVAPYQGWLGFYKSHMKALKWDSRRLVQEANKFALHGLAAPEIPTLQKSTVGKMGLKGVPGLKVGPNLPRTQHGRGG
jgi:ATP-dependent RNA helicase MSS116, mitochondrial